MRILIYIIIFMFSFNISAEETEFKCICFEYWQYDSDVKDIVADYECQDKVTTLKINTDNKIIYMDNKKWKYKDFQKDSILWGENKVKYSHLTTLNRNDGTLDERRMSSEKIFSYVLKSKCEKNEKLF